MNQDLCWLLILLIFAIIFYYSNKNNNEYLIKEGFRNSRVYLGDSPIKNNDFLYMNNNDFGSHSIYEVGKIEYPNNNSYQTKYPNYYSSYYADYYSSYI